MKVAAALVVWALLLVLLGAEFLAVHIPGWRSATPFLGIGMALLVAMTFMRLGSSRGLPPAFALAGLFWLCVLLGLGGMDSFTRHDIQIVTQHGQQPR